jgi:hypothetical protein
LARFGVSKYGTTKYGTFPVSKEVSSVVRVCTFIPFTASTKTVIIRLMECKFSLIRKLAYSLLRKKIKIDGVLTEKINLDGVINEIKIKGEL